MSGIEEAPGQSPDPNAEQLWRGLSIIDKSRIIGLSFTAGLGRAMEDHVFRDPEIGAHESFPLVEQRLGDFATMVSERAIDDETERLNVPLIGGSVYRVVRTANDKECLGGHLWTRTRTLKKVVHGIENTINGLNGLSRAPQLSNWTGERFAEEFQDEWRLPREEGETQTDYLARYLQMSFIDGIGHFKTIVSALYRRDE